MDFLRISHASNLVSQLDIMPFSAVPLGNYRETDIHQGLYQAITSEVDVSPGAKVNSPTTLRIPGLNIFAH